MNSGLKSMHNQGKLSAHHFIIFLQLACFLIFAGRAWQHWFWDGPYRSVLWDEGLLKGFFEGVLGISWGSYVTSPTADKLINLLTRAIGAIFTLSAISAFFITSRFKKLAITTLKTGTVFMIILAFISYKARFFQIGEWLEFGVQLGSPIILLMLISGKYSMKTLVLLGKIAVAITFVGHGFYAAGFYAQPGNYVDMVINIFGWQEDNVRLILKIAGFMDFLVAFYLFVPSISRYVLLYCVVWGTLTAFARIAAGFDMNFALSTLSQWTFETVYRIPHGILPFWLYLVVTTASGSTMKMKEDYVSEG